MLSSSLGESLRVDFVAKVKFPSTVFKLDSPKWFCEKVGRLLLRGDKLNFHSVIFYFLTWKVIIYLKVFGFFIKYKIGTEFDTALVVKVEMGRLVV